MSISQTISELRTQLSLMTTDDDRRDAIQKLLDGFCAHCGSDHTARVGWDAVCYCRNDE